MTKHLPEIVLVVDDEQFRSHDEDVIHNLRQIRLLLEAILRALKPPSPVPAGLILIAGPVTEQAGPFPGAASPMKTITDVEKFTYGVGEADAKGAVIPGAVVFDAPPTWSSSNPNVAAVGLNADGQSGDVVAGVPGTTTISVQGTVGGKAVAGAEDVTVTPSAPTQIVLTAGPVSEQ